MQVSDTPAWIVSKANQYARDHGMRQFVVYQGRWSAAERSFERDIIHMCEAEGMGLAPWGALGGGNFKTASLLPMYRCRSMLIWSIGGTKKQLRRAQSSPGERSGSCCEQSAREDGEGERHDHDQCCVSLASAISPRKRSPLTIGTSLAYVMHKTPNVFPIVGGRKIDHLKGNIEALSIKLTPEDIEEIEDSAPFDPGFPMNFLFMGHKSPTAKGSDIWIQQRSTHLDSNERPRPIEPRTQVE